MNSTIEDFHFYRVFRGDESGVSRQRHKHYLFSRLRLKPGMSVLDVGCGTGSAALELAQFANVHVCGVDTDPQKILEANRKAHLINTSASVTFVHVPVLESAHQYLPCEAFDAIYSIESLRSVSNLPQLYANLSSLLRPGGKFASYEWCWTNTFNTCNVDHRRMAELFEVSCGMGAGSSADRTAPATLAALQAAKFFDVQYDDLATVNSSASVPWYSLLDTALSSGRTRWADDSGDSGALGHLTREAAALLSEAGHLQLFTPMALVVGTRRE